MKPLLSEILRPQTLADLVLQENIRRLLERVVESRSIQNLLFYGKPGIGKTSACRILLRELNAQCYEINGSFNHGDKSMLRHIEGFAYTCSLHGGPKICFIDEADHMSKDIQGSLRYIIERASDNTRFLLTANEIKRLTPAIISRCHPICFDVSQTRAREVVETVIGRYEQKLKENGYSYDPKRLREIVCAYFPDLRRVANQLEWELGLQEQTYEIKFGGVAKKSD
jgi:DNA polymerase III delta prime subunit